MINLKNVEDPYHFIRPELKGKTMNHLDALNVAESLLVDLENRDPETITADELRDATIQSLDAMDLTFEQATAHNVQLAASARKGRIIRLNAELPLFRDRAGDLHIQLDAEDLEHHISTLRSTVHTVLVMARVIH